MSRHSTALGATLAGVVDRLRSRGAPEVALAPSERLEGRTCVVTGGNRGLGRAIALGLGRLGGRIVLACRSGGQAAAAELAALTGAPCEAIEVDLADLRSVATLADRLRDEVGRIDRLVLNAGVVPRASRETADGFDLMFQVNYLANVALVERLLADGLLADADSAGDRARLVAVGSESHRASAEVDLQRLGAYEAYGIRAVMAHYGTSKLLLTTWARQLARRLEARAGDRVPPSVAVFGPGAVATDIAREAPAWVRPALGAVMKVAFQSPEGAARPAVWLAAAAELADQGWRYQHLTRARDPDPRALDEAFGAALFDASLGLIASRATD